MTGQIPKYGENFTHDRVGSYHPELADTFYYLTIDPEWFIRSDKTSKRWQVFHGMARDTATPHGKVQPNMRGAMALLLAGIAGEFYRLADPLPVPPRKVRVKEWARGRWVHYAAVVVKDFGNGILEVEVTQRQTSAHRAGHTERVDASMVTDR